MISCPLHQLVTGGDPTDVAQHVMNSSKSRCTAAQRQYDNTNKQLSWVQESATVACRQLGFQNGFFRPVENDPGEVSLLPPWIGSTTCTGNESTILGCGALPFGNTTECVVSPALRLFCDTNPGRCTLFLNQFCTFLAV